MLLHIHTLSENQQQLNRQEDVLCSDTQPTLTLRGTSRIVMCLASWQIAPCNYCIRGDGNGHNPPMNIQIRHPCRLYIPILARNPPHLLAGRILQFAAQASLRHLVVGCCTLAHRLALACRWPLRAGSLHGVVLLLYGYGAKYCSCAASCSDSSL